MRVHFLVAIAAILASLVAIVASLVAVEGLGPRLIAFYGSAMTSPVNPARADHLHPTPGLLPGSSAESGAVSARQAGHDRGGAAPGLRSKQEEPISRKDTTSSWDEAATSDRRRPNGSGRRNATAKLEET